ncbi:fatty acyl-CoA reductase wat-like [Zerene cesonia]|uniref:fatty acyl-CoA reductase wat-like n=1 Tax=Zerene cesonia TaxID=33412 RepID=UPI0018E4EB17|nr:fatty acyl-CoA reductase wat-like [Zerene cesonia]
MAVTTLKEGNDITFSDMVDEMDFGESEIEKAFSGATVLLTGGTGFLGKLLIEKLLRSCPGIKKMFLLARPKKNKDPTKRLQEQFDEVLYDKLRKIQPDFIDKIQLVEGDISHASLGISEQDRQMISDEVDFIFHGAATVRFDESLKTAVAINVRGSREMLTLARSCTKLRSYVHISTAYSNCTQNEIEEKFYESPLDGDKLIDLVENMDENIIKNITPGLLGDFPNTYAYTKAVAEDIVRKHSVGLPVALFRPSIVIATAEEPVAGWIDNVYGPTGVVVGAAVGLLRVINCDLCAAADLVPGDMVVRACVAVAWRAACGGAGLANSEHAPADVPPPVYNYVSAPDNPLTWHQYMKLNEIQGLKVPPTQAIWCYLLVLTQTDMAYAIYSFFLHWVPAYIIDAIAVVIGKKPMLKKAYRKIEKFSTVISYFSCRQWKFSNQNVQNLYKELCKADRHNFNFNMSELDWDMYFHNHVRGIRLYLLKDPLDTVPQGLRKQNMLKVANYLLIAILGFVFVRLMWWITKLVIGF